MGQLKRNQDEKRSVMQGNPGHALGEPRFRSASPATSLTSATRGVGHVFISTTGQHYAYGDGAYLGDPNGAATPTPCL